MVLDEYYPGAFEETYLNRQGYLYLCEKPDDCCNPTNIMCALTSERPVKVLSCLMIENVGKQLLAYQEQGKLQINLYDKMPSARRKRLEEMMGRRSAAQETTTTGL